MPLNEKAMEIHTVRNKSRSIKSNFVFYNKQGNKIVSSNLGRSFRSIIKKAGIEKFRFHDLRHTFATRLIQNGIDIYTVQRLGRWKSIPVVCVMRITMQRVYGAALKYWINWRINLSQSL